MQIISLEQIRIAGCITWPLPISELPSSEYTHRLTYDHEGTRRFEGHLVRCFILGFRTSQPIAMGCDGLVMEKYPVLINGTEVLNYTLETWQFASCVA